MKWEYLLFNLVVVTGPVIFSFESRIHYVSRWLLALLVCVLVMIPYAAWDALVTGKHWWFSDTYTLGVRFLGLPLEEWLFFITVPFACLFIWDVLNAYWPPRVVDQLRWFQYSWFVLLLIGVGLFLSGKHYSASATGVLGLVVLLDMILRTQLLLRPQTYIYIGLLCGLILVFNGYLTARPVVLYGEGYQLGWRVFTIPIEDFGYGVGLVLSSTVLYEKLKAMMHG